MTLDGIDRIWFLTWTTYGSWLPGDERGFVSPKFDGDSPERRNNVPGDPYDRGRAALQRIAKGAMESDPIRLNHIQAEVVRRQFEETARHRGWRILAGAIMANHVHLVVGVSGDPDPAVLLRDFKSYASRALNRGRSSRSGGTWWTEQGSKRKISDWENLETLLRYVREQPHPLESWEEDASEGERGASAPCPLGRPMEGHGADAPRSPESDGQEGDE